MDKLLFIISVIAFAIGGWYVYSDMYLGFSWHTWWLLLLDSIIVGIVWFGGLLFLVVSMD